MIEGATLLLTGGAGFIGAHLAEALIAAGKEVAVVDDLSTGSLNNLAALRGHPRFQFTEGSVQEDRTLSPLVERVDFVYHLAAAVGVPYLATVSAPTSLALDLAERAGMVLASLSPEGVVMFERGIENQGGGAKLT